VKPLQLCVAEDATAMDDMARRARVKELFVALSSRDPDRIAAYVDDDIDLTIYGPVDVMPFFGHRRGRDAVLKMYREIPTYLEYMDYALEGCLVDGDQAALFVRASARMLKSGRVMTWYMGHFITFQDGKVVKCRSLYDSFDIAEQALGREIDLGIVA
jgi:ketosteroid isomerase-like protein